jgi:hypothetical protein
MNKRLHKGPSASAILALRREKVKPAELRRIGQALEHREARLRSGWDCYHTVRAVISGPDDLRQWTKVPDGAIEAARHGDVSRQLDCLRAHKPFKVGDRDRLAAYIAMKKRRRLWSPELVRALSCPPTDDDYDLLADVVAEVGRKRGRVFDAPAHRAARLAEVLLSLAGLERIPALLREATIAYGCELVGNESGVKIETETVRNLLSHPTARARRH